MHIEHMVGIQRDPRVKGPYWGPMVSILEYGKGRAQSNFDLNLLGRFADPEKN